MDWFCKRRGITELKPQDLEGHAFKIITVFHPDVIHLQYQMEECHKLLTDSVDDSILRHNVSKPLPLGGPPGQVIIQFDFFFNKDLEYLRYCSKGSRPALSISKMKAAYYPDVGLEQMVPDQIWIAEECKYDIAAMYGISQWWFQRQRFYIDRHTSEEKSMNHDHFEELAQDLAEACKKKKKSRESPKTPPGSPPHQPPPPPLPAGPSGASRAPGASGSSQASPPPPPPPSTNQESQSKGSAAPSSSKIAALVEYQAWMTSNIRFRPFISLTPADLQMDEDMAPDEQAQSSDDEDIGSAHIPKVNLRQD
nr:hypothetical protein [Tanacetum cinerariifolium]